MTISRQKLLRAGLAVLALVACVTVLSSLIRGGDAPSEGDVAAPPETAESSGGDDGGAGVIDDEMVLGPRVLVSTNEVFVSPGGNDSNDGRSSERPVRTLEAAAGIAVPGDEIILAPGVYLGQSRVRNLHGTASEPIVIRGAGAGTILDAGTISSWDTLRVEGSSHLVFRDFVVTAGIHGTFIDSASDLVFERVVWREVGQEGVQIDGSSNNLRFSDCSVSRTGLHIALYGEGFYVASARGDADVRNVTIEHCEIFETTAEAVDIKRGARNVTVAHNYIHDIDTATSGAVVAYLGEWTRDFEPGITIHSNRIENVTKTSQWADGNGIALNSAAQVYNNVITGMQHRGIIIEGGFGDAPGVIEIFNNTVDNVGLVPIEIRSGAERVRSENNIGLPGPGNIVAAAGVVRNHQTGDYRLFPGSAAVDAAAGRVAALDIEGMNRPPESADVGAYELTTGPAPAPTPGQPQSSQTPTTAAPTTAAPTTAAPSSEPVQQTTTTASTQSERSATSTTSAPRKSQPLATNGTTPKPTTSTTGAPSQATSTTTEGASATDAEAARPPTMQGLEADSDAEAADHVEVPGDSEQPEASTSSLPQGSETDGADVDDGEPEVLALVDDGRVGDGPASRASTLIFVALASTAVLGCGIMLVKRLA